MKITFIHEKTEFVLKTWITGKEKILINNKLVSEKRNIAENKSEHSFIYNGENYNLKFDISISQRLVNVKLLKSSTLVHECNFDLQGKPLIGNQKTSPNIEQNNNQRPWGALLFGGKGSSAYNKFTDPEWTAKMGLIFAVIIILFDILWIIIFKKDTPSTYITGTPLIIGIIGTYFSFKKQVGWITALLNMLVVVLGFVALMTAVFVESLIKL
ncbi:hypothetical protein ACFL49_00085 [Candidatus Omnitrophota bacterium]